MTIKYPYNIPSITSFHVVAADIPNNPDLTMQAFSGLTAATAIGDAVDPFAATRADQTVQLLQGVQSKYSFIAA